MTPLRIIFFVVVFIIMKFIITESQLHRLLNEEFSQEVADIQKDLISKGYDLGNYGPNEDGVDGMMGKLTKRAYEKEFGKSYEPKQSVVKDTSSSFVEPNISGEYQTVLIGGLDYRKGDYKIDQQVSLLKKSVSGNIKGFRYNASDSDILSFLEQNPGITVIMFSAGCNKANTISKSPNVNKNKIYIVEPYAKNGNSSVVNAVNNGVPASNVFVGSNSARGKGVVPGAVSSESSSHWGALENIGNLI